MNDNEVKPPQIQIPKGNQPAFGDWGLTIRDYLAAQALTGLIAAESDANGYGAMIVDKGVLRLSTDVKHFATMAYQLADAMLVARGE